MADNATPSSDPPVATDDIAGIHYQRIKLVDGTLDGTAGIPGSAARGLAVDPRAYMQRLAVSSSGLTTASTAYVAGDQLGAQLSFTGATRASGGYGRVRSATLVDLADVIGAVDLFLFRASVAPAADNAAAAFSDADMAKFVGLIQFPYADDVGGARCSNAHGLDLVYDTDGGTTLYGALVTRSGHTFFGAGTDLSVALFTELL